MQTLSLSSRRIFGQGAAQGGDEHGGGGEEDPVAVLDGIEAEAYGQVGFAHAGRPEDDEVLAVLDAMTV